MKGFRLCQIGNYISIPCGGVHVKNTKEIGELVLKEIVEIGRQKLTMKVK
jgi:Ser-tRNA(Ala) deacylase AlaX